MGKIRNNRRSYTSLWSTSIDKYRHKKERQRSVGSGYQCVGKNCGQRLAESHRIYSNVDTGADSATNGVLLGAREHRAC